MSKLLLPFVCCAASLAAGFALAWIVRTAQMNAMRADFEREAALQAATRAAQHESAMAQARFTENHYREQLHEAENEFAQRMAENAADLRALHAELDRLRDAVRAARAVPAGGVPADTAAAADCRCAERELLADCATQLADLAANADRHAADARRLRDSWPSEGARQ